jgi:DNA-binding IclR family transcriptional regulator
MVEQTDNVDRIKATETSFRLIEALVDRDGAMVTELASELGIANSTAYRHLQTLSELGYMVNDDGVYKVSHKPLFIGDSARKNILGYKFIKQHVDECHQQTNERIQFIIEEDGYGTTIYRAKSEKSVATDVNLGESFFLTTSAAGKAILAEKPEKEVREIINKRGLPSETETSITDEERLMSELEDIRERGYSVNRSEHISGLWAVGVSIKDPVDDLIGAISISGPEHRMQGDSFEDVILNPILNAADQIELDITYTQ